MENEIMMDIIVIVTLTAVLMGIYFLMRFYYFTRSYYDGLRKLIARNHILRRAVEEISESDDMYYRQIAEEALERVREQEFSFDIEVKPK